MQIICNTGRSYHVQHVVCNLVRRDSSAIRFDRVEIAFILALSNWMKTLADEGGEETGLPGEKKKNNKKLRWVTVGSLVAVALQYCYLLSCKTW